MRSKRQVLALFGIVLLMSAGVARADVYQINFDSLGWDDTFNGDPIPDGWVDEPGPYSVSYRAVTTDETGIPNVHDFLNYLHKAGQDLTDVAFSTVTPPNVVEVFEQWYAEVAITADPGYCLDFGSFQMASPITSGFETDIRIYADGALQTNPLIPLIGPIAETITYGIVDVSKILIQWTWPNFVAIDNITFTVDPCTPAVPEPATLVSWMLGVGAFGFVAYRRRRLTRG